MEGAGEIHRVVILADGGHVPIALVVPAAGGFVGRVTGFDFSLAREEEDVGAHFLSVFRGGRNHDQRGAFERLGFRVWVEEVG